MAGRKVGGAVQRNRAKRRLRAALAEIDLPDGFDVVVVARDAVLTEAFDRLTEQLRRLVARAATRISAQSERASAAGPEARAGDEGGQRQPASLRRVSPLARLLLAVVRAYQLVPQLRPSPCRFFPSCSVYAAEALRVHGALHGTWLTARRLARCHPFHPGGVDHVPSPARGATPVANT